MIPQNASVLLLADLLQDGADNLHESQHKATTTAVLLTSPGMILQGRPFGRGTLLNLLRGLINHGYQGCQPLTILGMIPGMILQVVTYPVTLDQSVTLVPPGVFLSTCDTCLLHLPSFYLH